MATKNELLQFTIINNTTDCDITVPFLSQNSPIINATKKYSWDITGLNIGCGCWSIVINGITYQVNYNGTLVGLLTGFTNLGFSFFCSTTIGGQLIMYTLDDYNVYGDVDSCFCIPTTTTTSTTTTTTTPTPTTTTTSSTTTTTTSGGPTTTTTTTTTTATPTTTTTTTATPTTTTTTTTTTATPTTTTTTTATPTTSTTTTTTTAGADLSIFARTTSTAGGPYYIWYSIDGGTTYTQFPTALTTSCVSIGTTPIYPIGTTFKIIMADSADPASNGGWYTNATSAGGVCPGTVVNCTSNNITTTTSGTLTVWATGNQAGGNNC